VPISSVKKNLTGSRHGAEVPKHIEGTCPCAIESCTALTDLAGKHRVAASAVERRAGKELHEQHQFASWIATVAEISMAAERLLELEIELARYYGMTWEKVAEVLGVSRQAAWERFRSHARWDSTHRTSRLRRTRRAAIFLRMAAGQEEEFIAKLRHMMQADRGR
jgi:hypothetical protein